MSGTGEGAEAHGGGAGAPWLGAPLLVSLRTSGPDPAIDDLRGLLALGPVEEGASWGELELACGPEEGLEAGQGGPDPALPPPAAAFRELWTFAAGRPLVVLEAESFGAWAARSGAARADLPPAVGLSELASLVAPSRLAVRPTDLLEALRPAREATGGATADAHALRAALAELLRRLAGRDELERELAYSGYGRAAFELLATEPGSARHLGLCLSLLAPAGVPGKAALEGWEPRPVAELLPLLEPAWTRRARLEGQRPPLPPRAEGPLPFEPADLALLDRVFAELLPADFGGGPASYRGGQHQVAREIAATLGAEPGELLLVHAPTGTGKTLAYLVPALLWARRHGLRVGVATYTRALQEQAMDREVPRALRALERAGAPAGMHVSTLKGRENYLCWRALERALPERGASGEDWLAWTQLALFALDDPTGELDRFPMRAPIRLESSEPYARALSELVAQVRARNACCTREEDRSTCAAEVARRRAERSHVVLTNHSFALARQDFFRHVVFDECEHLHDQAHAAWSHSLSLRGLRTLLARVHQAEDEGARGLLERIEQRLPPETRTHDQLRDCKAAHARASEALAKLREGVEEFVAWKKQELAGRDEREEHVLLAEYLGLVLGAELIGARSELSLALNALEAALATLAELLGALAQRPLARFVRSLGLARTDLAEAQAALEAWIPLHEGEPRISRQTYHDVQVDARGEATLVARVLLPNEYLGRYFLPQLETGVFLSATTWLKQGFQSSLSYLGLDRAAEPAPDEERAPSRVRTFRAPEAFDYSRVLVAVPRDAPPVARDKEEFLAYVGRFLATLGERTRGRILGLFTNSDDLRRVGARLESFFRTRRIPFWYQGMKGSSKEELGELFRRRADSILLGVDTFWYGADFPGEILEYLVIVKLPYGVPDAYHHAQCAALGTSEQRQSIYMPRALAKFRQGFGRLMRTTTDRGCVFVLDGRILEPRHRSFLRELPLRDALAGQAEGARLLRDSTEGCIREALEFMGRKAQPAAR